MTSTHGRVRHERLGAEQDAAAAKKDAGSVTRTAI
jgi:hypothetical protein